MNSDIGLAIGIIVFIGSLMIIGLFYFILQHGLRSNDEYTEADDN